MNKYIKKYKTLNLPGKLTFFGVILAAIGIILTLLLNSGYAISNNSDSNIQIGDDNQIINNYYSTCSEEEKSCEENTELLIVDMASLEGNCNNIYAQNNNNSNFNSGSISLWVKLNKLDLTHDRYLVDFVNMNNETFIKILISQNKIIKFSLKDSNSQEYLLSDNFEKNIDEWLSIIATWGNGEINLYINGEETQIINTKGTQFKEIVSGWYFGSSHLKRNCLNGKMDEIGLWGRPLTKDEVTQIYNNGDACQYPFDDC